MDTPSSDIFSVTGVAAGGTQIMLFTTGRGSPVGFPTVPVVKIASNTEKKPKLLDQVRNELRSRHYSRRTEAAYLGWIKRYIRFHMVRHAAEMVSLFDS